MKKDNSKMLLWGVGIAGEGFISMMSSTYLSYFLTDVAGLSVKLSGTVLLITSIAAFILATVTGAIIASVKPLKWGRLRSWLLVAPPVATLGFVLHFTSFLGRPVLSAVVTTISYIVASFAWNLAFTANISLTNIIATNQQERNRYNAQRMMGSNVGRLMGNYLTPILVAYIGAKIASERLSYPILVAIAGVFYIAMELIHFAISKGYEESYHEALNQEDKSIKFKDIVDILKSNGQLLVTLLIDLSSNMAGLALPSMAVYYYRYVVEDASMIPTHMLCIGLAGLAGSSIVRFFGGKVKSYKRYLLCVYIVLSLLLISTKLVQGNAIGFLVINIFVHLCTGTTQPFEMNLYQDNVIYSEWKTGVNANSMIMGLAELPVKIAGILRSMLITFSLMSAGYIAGADPTPAMKNALANAYAFIPAVIPLIGFLLLLFAYKLTPEKIATMKSEIAKRNGVSEIA